MWDYHYINHHKVIDHEVIRAVISKLSKSRKENGGRKKDDSDLRLQRQKKAPIRKHPANLGNKTRWAWDWRCALSEFIRFYSYIRKRNSTDKAWKNVAVVFNDASIPGVREHKLWPMWERPYSTRHVAWMNTSHGKHSSFLKQQSFDRCHFI